jgi:Rv3651-like, N-terminal
MADKWLLIETFGGEDHHEPSAIAVGRTVKRMLPLTSVLGRGRYLEDIRELVARVAESGEPVHARSHDGRRQMIGHPLMVTGHVHGVYAWLGDLDEEPPARDPAGTWYFNLTRDTTVRSDDLFDLYGVAPANRQYERRIAEMFGRLTTNSDEAAGLALLVRSRPGDEHQATWAVRREDNGQLRAANFACRVMAEPAENGQEETIVRGITHDIGAAVASDLARSGLTSRVAAGDGQAFADNGGGDGAGGGGWSPCRPAVAGPARGRLRDRG